MNYKETIDYLFNQLPVFQVIGPGAYKPGLDTAHRLSEAFGNPHLSFPTIHVGGTNGKGSTSHTLASVLMASGKKVGLFTSPHLFDFRERIRVNGQKIPEAEVTDFVHRYLNMNLDVAPSFFELTTIMAFDYFRRVGVDIAVIEVGLGGRLDTTNIITPLVSVVTNVSLDHMALLGNTEEEIAAEKAGIFKPGVPAVVGEAMGGVRKVFEDKAAAAGAPIVFAEDTPVDYKMQDGIYAYSYRGRWMQSDLQGDFQTKNINTVLHVLDLLEEKVDTDAVARGLASVQPSTGLVGRWMTIQAESPRVIIDTGHNIGAWRYLAPRLSKLSEQGPLRMVMGFVSDKDVTPIFSLLPKGAEYYFVTPSVKRGRTARSLCELAAEYGLKAKAYDTVAAGYEAALDDSAGEGIVFVGGSNFVVADLPEK